MRADRGRLGKARPAGRGKGVSIVIGTYESSEADINNGISPSAVQASIEHAPTEQAPTEQPLQTTTNDPFGRGKARPAGLGKARSARRGKAQPPKRGGYGSIVLERSEGIEAYINDVLSLPVLQAPIEHAPTEQASIERALQTSTNDPSARGKAQSSVRGKSQPARRGRGGSTALRRFKSIEDDINNGTSPPVVQAPFEHAPTEQTPIEHALQTTTNDPSGQGKAQSVGRGKAQPARRGGSIALRRFKSIKADINNGTSPPVVQAPFEHPPTEQAPIECALHTSANDPSRRGKAQSSGRGRGGTIALRRFKSIEDDINNGTSPPVVQAPFEHAPTEQAPIEHALQTTTNDPSRQGKAQSVGRGKAQPARRGRGRPTKRGKGRPAGRGKARPTGQGRSESIEVDISNGISPSVVQAPTEDAPNEQAPHTTTNDLSGLDLGNEVPESQAPTHTNTHHQHNKYLFRKSTDGRIYLEPYNKSYHPHQAVRDLSRIMKKNFVGPWVKWDVIPLEVKERWFSELKKLYIWEDRFDVEIKKLYKSFIAKRRLRSILYSARKAYRETGKKPAWMNNDCWDELLKKWADPKYKRQSIINSKNRLSNKNGLGPSCHAGGSIPYSEHKRKYEEMTGTEARPSQLFLMTHKRKGTGDFVDKKSKLVWEKFSSEMKKSLGNTSAAAEDSNSGQANARNVTVEQEASVWTRVVGGRIKGHIYGFGSDASVIGGEIPSYTPQASTQAQESSLEQVEMMRQEVERGKQERQEMLKELQDLRGMVQQLLAANGIPRASDPSACSNNRGQG